MSTLQTATKFVPVYRVEKFVPSECPKCRHAFKEEGRDYGRLLGDIVNGKKAIRETDGYDIIICTTCQNSTARVLLESWQCLDKARAQRLLQQGFTNLQEGKAFGEAARDRYQIHAQLAEVSVKTVRAK